MNGAVDDAITEILQEQNSVSDNSSPEVLDANITAETLVGDIAESTVVAEFTVHESAGDDKLEEHDVCNSSEELVRQFRLFSAD